MSLYLAVLLGCGLVLPPDVSTHSHGFGPGSDGLYAGAPVSSFWNVSLLAGDGTLSVMDTVPAGYALLDTGIEWAKTTVVDQVPAPGSEHERRLVELRSRSPTMFAKADNPRVVALDGPPFRDLDGVAIAHGAYYGWAESMFVLSDGAQARVSEFERQYLRLTDRIWDAGTAVLARGRRRPEVPSVAIHKRVGDRPDAVHDADRVAAAVADVCRSSAGPDDGCDVDLFVCTNSPDGPEVAAFIVNVTAASAPGLVIHVGSDLVPPPLDTDGRDGLAGNLDFLAAVEMVTAAQTTVFIPYCFSSFSEYVLQLRVFLGLPGAEEHYAAFGTGLEFRTETHLGCF